MSGMGIDLDAQEALMLLRKPSGVADLLRKADPENGISPADIFADVINIQRADVKMLAALNGVEQDIEMMPPERAAQLLAGTINGDGVALVEVFNELAEQRQEVLKAVMDPDEYVAYQAELRAAMFTEPDEDES